MGRPFTPERLIKFDLLTRQSEDLGPIALSGMGMAQGENVVLDNAGCSPGAAGR